MLAGKGWEGVFPYSTINRRRKRSGGEYGRDRGDQSRGAGSGPLGPVRHRRYATLQIMAEGWDMGGGDEEEGVTEGGREEEEGEGVLPLFLLLLLLLRCSGGQHPGT